MFNHISDKPILPELEAITTDAGRRYITPQGLYPSITTVLGSQPQKKDSLAKWRARVGEEEANKISHRASIRGTAVHELCENYINNMPNYSKGHMPANLDSFLSIKPILDENVDNVFWQEAPLYSDRLKTAGRVDLICEYNKQLSIVDFKTSLKPKKEEWIEDSYFVQAAFYAAALYERTGLTAKKGVIIIAVDDSEPQVFEFDTFDYLPRFIELRKTFKEEYVNE